jgi:CBS domain-containing protein
MRDGRIAMKSIASIVGERSTVTVERDRSIVEAARLMAASNVGAVPVVDKGRLVGIFSERDALNRVVAAGLNPAATKVGEVMTSELIVAAAGESYEACLARMTQAHVRHLVVLDKVPGGSLAGIVSLRDLLAADIDEKTEAITLLNAYVHYIPADLERKVRPL